MIKFIKSLQFIFQPKYWLKQYPYCPRLDIKINNYLDQGVKFANIGWYTTDLGDLKGIWIAGYPFAYGKLWQVYDYQPSRMTIKRMRQVMLKQIESEL